MATTNTIKARLRIARKTEAEWKASDPIALKDEWMVTSDGDSLKLKIGDGIKKWSELSYVDIGSKVVVDASLNNTSENPVQNKVVTKALDDKVSNTNIGVSNAINKLSVADAAPTDGDYYVSQYAGGGTTTTTYHRRPVSALLKYIKSKLATVASSGSYKDLLDKPSNIETASKLRTPRIISIGEAGTGSESFDGSSNIVLPLKSVKEAYLEWGGKNLTNSFSPLDASMIPQLGANRLAFMPSEAIEIQYSRDNGATWEDYEQTDSEKQKLFSGLFESALYIGGDANTGIDKSNYQLRITFTSREAHVYTTINKIVLYVSTGGCSGCWCTLDGKTHSNVASGNDEWTVFNDKVEISGWSGYNIINTNFTTFGGSGGSQYEKIRFTFGVTGHKGTKYSGLCLYGIMGFGGAGWITPSNMARSGNIYKYFADQSVIFPNTVKAKAFIGSLSGNATTATALISSAGSSIQPVYFINGKPVAIDYKLEANVPKSDGSTSKYLRADGTWVTPPNNTYSPPTLGGGYGTCDTTAETAAKVATLADYALVTGGICAIKFTNAVPNSATLNINGKGAKPIFYHNAALIDNVIASGDTVTFIYDGAKYHILSIDKIAVESLDNYYTKDEIDKLLANIQPASGDYSLMGISDLATFSTIKNHNLGATEIMNISLENIMDGMIDDVTNN